MRGAESSPGTPDLDWGPWTDDDGSADAVSRRERLRRDHAPARPRRRLRRRLRLRLRRHRRQRRSGRAPRSSTVLTVVAAILAVVGVALIGRAASEQVGSPTAPPVSAPSEEQRVPLATVDPVDQPLLLAAPWAIGPSPLGPHPARWWWGDLIDSPRGLLPHGPSAVPVRPTPTDPAQLARVRTLAAVPVSPPATIAVPSIGVSSPVDSVGLTPDGEMEVPAGPTYDRAAWYRHSVTPGRQGPTVIVGHVDSRERGPSVFYALGAVRPGDRVDVTRVDGTIVTYAVDDVRTVPKDAFPTDAVYGATPGAELRLITCGGSFDSSVRSYRDNVVVFAREVPPPPVRAAPPVPTTPSPGLPARIPMRLPGSPG